MMYAADIRNAVNAATRHAAGSSIWHATDAATRNAARNAIDDATRIAIGTRDIITNSIWDILNEAMNELG